ncbi:DNA polymerase III subunit delta' [Patescibacteria group bacterium]|nr:DNA polymerase III subunit delta' [Patescibacteria group bacterium]
MNVVGHKKQWNFLKDRFEQGQLSHAYLFAGPSEVGKKKFALDFIKLINCIGEKCKGKGTCKNCKMVEGLSHPDLLMVEAKDNSEIQISQIRQVQQFLSLKPYYSSFKVVLIDEAEKMNQEAQSCFLKTLEEPKGNTILILISSKPETLLTTIFSRCQVIKFFNISRKEIQDYFIEKGLPTKQAETIASISEGKLGRAIKLLDKDGLEKEKEALNEIIKVCGSDIASKFQYVKNLPEESFSKSLSIIKRYLRHLLFLKLQINDLSYLSEVSDKFKTMSIIKINRALKLTEKIDFQILTTNASQKLALEILLLEI